MELLITQERRRNRVAFILSTIVMVYVLVSVSVSSLNGGATDTRLIRIILFAAMLFLNIAGYIFFRNSSNYVRVCLNAFIVVYLSTLICSDSPFVYAYVFPMLICALIFMNGRYIYGGTLLSTVSNVFFFVKIISAAEYENSMVMQGLEQLCFVVLASIGVVMIYRQNTQFAKENEKVILEEAAALQKIADATVALAEQLIGKFDAAKEVSENLTEMMKTSNFSVSNIAESVTSTAQAIEDQTSMSADIHKTIEEAGKSTVDMQTAAADANQIAEESAHIVDELKRQAREVQVSSDTTRNTTYHLNEQVKNVEGIVESILSISNQTSLLALNASIEAARAGEAGRGFAVVAEQIRELSEQTKNASNKITEITGQLIADAQMTTESMEQSVITSGKQNELIEQTSHKFVDINQKVQQLNENAVNMNGMVQEIIKANGAIADSISQLSATSEEVAASSSECLSYSDGSMKALKNMNKLLGEIYVIAEDMKKCVQNTGKQGD